MAFVLATPQRSTTSANEIKVDIIGIPAIGADPNRTWARSGDDEHQWLGASLHHEIPSANVLLYDHLEPQERRLEVKATEDPAHITTIERFASAEAAIAGFGVEDWADRFLAAIRYHRAAHKVEHRPILFICHSTGGIVVKQALIKTTKDSQTSLADVCIGVAFFATPHHGSSVLSEPEYVQTVQQRLQLKWEMPRRLRQEFSLKNRDLELLNYRFAVTAHGVKVYSYVESQNTNLQVLSTSDSAGETLTSIGLCIVDGRSAKLSTPDIPVEDEEVIPLNSTHAGAPRFSNEDLLYSLFIGELNSLIQGFSADERAAYQALSSNIMTNIKVDIHQFYESGNEGEPTSMRVWSEHPSLKSFFDLGPTACLSRRLDKLGHERNGLPNGISKPKIEIEKAAPTISVALAPTNNHHLPLKQTSMQSLAAPSSTEPLKIIHPRRPSLSPSTSLESERPDHLAPHQAKNVHFNETMYLEPREGKPPQRPATYKLPSQASDRFKWIHVPVTHCGWVPHVLTTISQDKANLSLHTKLLLDQIWMSQHNRSRHASPHARFIRPSVKCLLPEGTSCHRLEGPHVPSSPTDEVQLVIYLPYLHWDSYRNLKLRAAVIEKRRKQGHSHPIDREVVEGRSMENKLIWQYLSSERPIHCRRTLDQYGYPSLRNTAVRDADQILYKRTKTDKAASSAKDPPKKSWHPGRSSSGRKDQSAPEDISAKVLMVDQLWLWVIDAETVITFVAPKEEEEDDGGTWKQGDVRTSIYNDVNGDYARKCSDPFDFAALAVFHAVKALLDHTTDLNLQVFRIFEEYISILTEQQTVSFKEFRNNHTFKDPKDLDVKRLPKYVDNRADLDALLELRDIEDELNTIDKLFKEQSRGVSDMIHHYEDLKKHRGKGLHGIHLLQEVSHSLNEYKEQIISMLKSAQAAQRAFKELLDMKQKQANIVEAHLAREQTEVAADQSRSVMIFTIFTIIFLPLSFFASVFGINAREWSGVSSNWSLHSIFLYMGSISVGVIFIALLVAFNRPTRKLAREAWKQTARPVHRLLAKVIRKSKRQYHETGELGEALEAQRSQVVDDARAFKRLESMSRSYSKMNWEDEDVEKTFGRMSKEF